MIELIKAFKKLLINNIFHMMKISKEGVDMCINVIWGALGFGNKRQTKLLIKKQEPPLGLRTCLSNNLDNRERNVLNTNTIFCHCTSASVGSNRPGRILFFHSF